MEPSVAIARQQHDSLNWRIECVETMSSTETLFCFNTVTTLKSDSDIEATTTKFCESYIYRKFGFDITYIKEKVYLIILFINR